MNIRLFSQIAAFALLAALASASPGEAADPLCLKIKNQTRKDRCVCHSDAGARVYRHQETNKVVHSPIRGARQAEIFECMRKKGHAAG